MSYWNFQNKSRRIFFKLKNNTYLNLSQLSQLGATLVFKGTRWGEARRANRIVQSCVSAFDSMKFVGNPASWMVKFRWIFLGSEEGKLRRWKSSGGGRDGHRKTYKSNKKRNFGFFLPWIWWCFFSFHFPRLYFRFVCRLQRWDLRVNLGCSKILSYSQPEMFLNCS